MNGADARAARYAWLWVFGAAAGYLEAAVVVYLRELFYPHGFRFPLQPIPARLALVETVREAVSLVLLAAAARLAGRRGRDRFGAFMLLFGAWDLVYYAVLKLVLGWPRTLADWDVLFLIPLPWVGPVWAPCLVSLALVAAGSYDFWTGARPRIRHGADWAMAAAGGLLVIGSFLAEGDAVLEQRLPERFPAWLLAAGMLMGTAAWLRAETRPAAPRP